MNPAEFYTYLFDNFYQYLIIFAFGSFLYWILLRKYVYSIFDPLFFSSLASCMGFVVVLFLFSIGQIKRYYFLSYLLTQIAFFIGFIVFRPVKATFSQGERSQKTNVKALKFLFILSSVGYIASQLLIYVTLGIPLFMESRQNLFVGVSSLLNAIQRIYVVCGSITGLLVFYFLFFYDNKKFKFYSTIVLLFVLTASFLSGSKGTFFGFVTTMFLFVFYMSRFYPVKNKSIQIIKKVQSFIFILAVFAACLVIVIQKSSDIRGSFFYLILSIVQRGDVYWYAYPNGMIEKTEDANPFITIFSGILGNLNIISKEDLPEPLGVQLYKTQHKTDLILGPNPRHNVFGLHYFGFYLSPFYSFILGFILGFVRNKLYYILPRNVLGCVIYALLIGAFNGIETDVHLTLSGFTNLMFLIPFLLFGAWALAECTRGVRYEVERTIKNGS